jgi:hypothetical protein
LLWKKAQYPTEQQGISNNQVNGNVNVNGAKPRHRCRNLEPARRRQARRLGAALACRGLPCVARRAEHGATVIAAVLAVYLVIGYQPAAGRFLVVLPALRSEATLREAVLDIHPSPSETGGSGA